MKSLHKNLELGNVLVCFHEGHVIAMMNVYCNNMETKEAYICNVEVLKEYRGRRISRRLMADALALCRKNHFDTASLFVAFDNEIARHLYDTEDFLLTGLEKQEGGKTLLEMRKIL